MAQEITVFQGDTFIADGLYTDAENTPVDLNTAGITVESYVRDRNDVKFPLTVTFSPGIGEYHIEGDTSDWPLGRILWFVRYTDADNKKKSAEPVVLNVEMA